MQVAAINTRGLRCFCIGDGGRYLVAIKLESESPSRPRTMPGVTANGSVANPYTGDLVSEPPKRIAHLVGDSGLSGCALIVALVEQQQAEIVVRLGTVWIDLDRPIVLVF